MTSPERPVVIVGNWKMYKTIEQSVAFVTELLPHIKEATAKVYLAVPFTSLKPVADLVKNSSIVVGAQNMHDASEGAFTGEVAAVMLKEAGAQFVILGHSERRRLFHEDNAFINKKVKRALEYGIQPILCIGETLQEREDGKTQEVLKTQLSEGLKNIATSQLTPLMIAYEPLWAIGTDQTATPEIAKEVLAFCRHYLAETWGPELAEKIVILYGGSVKPNNAKALIEQPDIDGLLVGGASLSVQKFSQIVNYNQS